MASRCRRMGGSISYQQPSTKRGEAQWDAVHARLAVRSQQAQRGARSPKTTTTPYMLRGLIHCGICERKMQGNKAHGTLRYRCITTQTRALPAYLSQHPKAVYVR